MEAEQLNIETPKRTRRWYQFRLRTLLVVVTLFCLIVGWIAIQARVAHQRKAALAGYSRFIILYSFVDEDSRVALTSPLKRLFGDKPIAYMVVSAALSGDDLKRLREVFPEAEIELRRVPEVR
jgi:hypothetical protein